MEEQFLQYELGHRNGDLIFTVKSIVRPLLLLSIDWGLCEIVFWNGFICVTCQHIPGQFDLQTRVPWVCSQWKPSSKHLKYLQHVPANGTSQLKPGIDRHGMNLMLSMLCVCIPSRESQHSSSQHSQECFRSTILNSGPNRFTSLTKFQIRNIFSVATQKAPVHYVWLLAE